MRRASDSRFSIRLQPVATAGKFCIMKTLTVEEAVSGLGQWLEQALAGEDIRIRKGDRVVELRPVSAKSVSESPKHLSPREALRCLQRDAGLAPERAESYLREVHEERLTGEDDRGQ
jgi:hypothetical protein